MALKIKAEHLAVLKTHLPSFDTPENRALYLARQVPRADLVKDWDKRYRWDVFHAIGRALNPHGPGTKWCCDELYPYLNDDHIDSALRSIVPPLEVKP